MDRFADDKFDRIKNILLDSAPGFSRFLEALRFSSLNREWSLRNRESFTPILDKRVNGANKLV